MCVKRYRKLTRIKLKVEKMVNLQKKLKNILGYKELEGHRVKMLKFLQKLNVNDQIYTT